MLSVEIKFKRVHPDAQLPAKKHGNREINAYEQDWLKTENDRFAQERPEQFAQGYRIGLPFEMNDMGFPTNLILGTGDTGYDIFCVEDKKIPSREAAIVSSGIDVAYITPGYWFRIEPRSGMGFKGGIQPHLGVIDNPYRGNLGVKLYNFSDDDYFVAKGDRIAQMVIYPVIEAKLSWSDEKFETARNENGTGSSGK